jgi:hypothetical protein
MDNVQNSQLVIEWMVSGSNLVARLTVGRYLDTEQCGRVLSIAPLKSVFIVQRQIK